MCIASASVRVLLGSKDIVGSSYVMVSATKCLIARVCPGRVHCMVRDFGYQLVSDIARMVTVSESCFAASHAQCIVCCVVSASFGWAYLIPFHLY
jgi:hypothetical protein